MSLPQSTSTDAAGSSANLADQLQLPPSTSSAARRPRQRPVTYCLPPSSWKANLTDGDAQACLQKLIATQSKQQGFDAASASALRELSHLTERFILSIFAAANHGAELSNRHVPSARDLVYALETHGLPIHELRQFSHDQQQQQQQQSQEKQDQSQHAAPLSEKALGKARAKTTFPAPIARSIDPDSSTRRDEEQRYAWIDPTSAFLPSDSDGNSDSDSWSVSSDSEAIHSNRKSALHARIAARNERKQRLEARRRRREAKMAADPSGRGRSLDVSALEQGEIAWKSVADHIVPRHLPGRPPRHCWIHTAAYPPNAYSSGGTSGPAASHPLVLVNRKLANARLVESSLRRLIQSTDSVAALAFAAAREDATGGPADAGSAGSRPVRLADAPGGRDRSRQISGQSRDEPSPRSGTPVASVADTVGTGAAPTTGSAPTPSDGVFATPKPPSRGSLTLRLKNKTNLPATTTAGDGGGSGGGGGGFVPPLQTPLTRSRRSTLTTPTGFPSLDPLASPLTPSGNGLGAPTTPYPPTPTAFASGAAAGGGHYFGAQLVHASHPLGWSNAAAVPRSRSGSVAGSILLAGQGGPAGLGRLNGSQGGQGEGEGAEQAKQVQVQMQVRMPGTVNYKNVWYSPANSGRGAAGSTEGGSARGTKRLRKWKV